MDLSYLLKKPRTGKKGRPKKLSTNFYSQLTPIKLPLTLSIIITPFPNRMFRDAKQYAGRENSQAESGNKLNFHFNAELKTVNMARIMQLSNPETRENSFYMAKYKILFHNNLLLSRFFRLFAINPNSIKNHQHVKELLNFSTMAA